MTRSIVRLLAALLLGFAATLAQAQANLQLNTPAIDNLKKSMRERHKDLRPYLENGAVGLTREGGVALRDANAVPLPQRAVVNKLVEGENADRAGLYKEIASANGKPEWEGEIRSTFAQRFIERARPGWYVQDAQGQWTKK